jgi:hypothetical protein
MRRRAYSKMADEALLGRIAMGESLRVICRDEGMQSAWAVLRRLAVDEDFAKRFELARAAHADVLFRHIASLEALIRSHGADPPARPTLPSLD